MEEKKEPHKKSGLSNYLKFSGLAFQMGATITLGALLGRWLDERQGNETAGWTLGLILFAIFVSLYQIIREVIKIGKEDEKK